MAGKLTISTLNDSSGVFATQNAMSGICQAWIDYSNSAQTIKASFNVSSVTYNGTGDFTINFTTALADANYAITGFTRNNNASPNAIVSLSATSTSTKTSSALQVQTTYWNGAYGTANVTDACVAIFR
jgi:hypothetical protein